MDHAGHLVVKLPEGPSRRRQNLRREALVDEFLPVTARHEDDQRRRQAAKVREIVDGLVAAGEHVVVLGDLNQGQPAPDQPPQT